MLALFGHWRSETGRKAIALLDRDTGGGFSVRIEAERPPRLDLRDGRPAVMASDGTAIGLTDLTVGLPVDGDEALTVLAGDLSRGIRYDWIGADVRRIDAGPAELDEDGGQDVPQTPSWPVGEAGGLAASLAVPGAIASVAIARRGDAVTITATGADGATATVAAVLPKPESGLETPAFEGMARCDVPDGIAALHLIRDLLVRLGPAWLPELDDVLYLRRLS